MGIEDGFVGGGATPVIVGIIVTFLPEVEALHRLLLSLKSQVTKIIVVDNGSKGGDLASYIPVDLKKAGCELVQLENNYGIAVAQNTGIEMSRQLKADYVILFDQDSEPAHDMVGKLLSVAQDRLDGGIEVAAVGPRYLDNRQNNPPPFIKVKAFKVERQDCPDFNSVAEVDYLISSGCLIPLAALDKVGGMQEELFIDYVDIEWGLRAQKKGLQSFGVCAATMQHQLGEEPVVFMGKKFPVRTPLRHYYMFRNAIWMYRQDWVPTQWKIYDFWRLLLKYGFYSLFAKPRYEHLWMMTLGLWHGLVGKHGKLQGGEF